MIKTKCAICKTEDNSTIKYESNFDENSFTVSIFSARRMPDRRYFQWVECNNCKLWRSDPIIELPLEVLYMESSFDYGDEVFGLSKTYLKLFERTKPARNPKVLEIGGGNGFFLEAVLNKFDAKIAGVEPSVDAINKATSRVKPHMKAEMMRAGLYAAESFSQVCVFHVLDHLPSPKSTLSEIYDILENQGSVLVAVHNVEALSSKLLKTKSPIFDVEHTYLYSKKSITALLESCGFKDIKVRKYWNLYSLKYLIQLLPIPSNVKASLLTNRFTSKMFGMFRIWVPLGNMTAIGRKIS